MLLMLLATLGTKPGPPPPPIVHPSRNGHGRNVFATLPISTLSAPVAVTQPYIKLPPTKVSVNQAFALFLNNDGLATTSVTLNFIKPDGTPYVVSSATAFEFGAMVLSRQYIVYVAADNEFDQFGWWLVTAVGGVQNARQYTFYIWP